MANPVGREERQVLAAYLARHRLKRSAQREVILDAFLQAPGATCRSRTCCASSEAPRNRTSAAPRSTAR